jgi:hypothetical protein
MTVIRTYQPQGRNPLTEVLNLNIPMYFAPEEQEDFQCYLDQHAENYFIVEKITGQRASTCITWNKHYKFTTWI